MDYRSLHMKTVVDLRQIAKAEGVKLPAGVNKARIVELILEKQAAAEAEPQAKTPAVQPQPAPEAPEEDKTEASKAEETEGKGEGLQNSVKLPKQRKPAVKPGRK